MATLPGDNRRAVRPNLSMTALAFPPLGRLFRLQRLLEPLPLFGRHGVKEFIGRPALNDVFWRQTFQAFCGRKSSDILFKKFTLKVLNCIRHGYSLMAIFAK